MQWDKQKIALILSVILNIAGGFGIVPPVTGTPEPCPERTDITIPE